MKNKLNLILVSAILFAFLLAPSVFADEVLNPTAGDSFNLGDTIHLNGYITLDESASAAKVLFYAENEGLDERIEITEKYYTFTRGVPATFSQINKGTLSWVVPSDIKKDSDWTINVKVKKNTRTLTDFSSESFDITDKLSIVAGVNSDMFNFGHELILGGTILDAGNQPVDGIADIYIEEETYGLIFSAKSAVVNGYLQYSYQFNSSAVPGNYTVLVELNDTDGNSDSFSITNLILSNSLSIVSSPQKYELESGEPVIVTGTVRNVRGNPVQGLTVYSLLTVPDKESAVKYSEKSDSNGKFAFTINLPERAPPGKYPLEIITNDSFENVGRDEHTLEVGITREISASLNLNKTTMYQGESLNLTYVLDNTGNVDLSGEIELYLDGKKVKETTFSVGRGSRKTIETDWEASEEAGSHEIYASIIIDDEKLSSSDKKEITILERKQPFEFNMDGTTSLFILVAAVLLIVVYLKRRDIKEYFWHKEYKKKAEKSD
ncbi:MAG: hypothetical protein R6U26_03180 [Candidatus Undinarchaeales archaeon]